MSEIRLYGVPDSETLHTDLGAAYESQIEPERIEEDATPWIIEEWTVVPSINHLPHAERIIEDIVEQVADDAPEEMYDRVADLISDPAVLAAAEALRVTFAERITCWTADKKVAEHVITWDADNEPLVDGKPMYVASEIAGKDTDAARALNRANDTRDREPFGSPRSAEAEVEDADMDGAA